MSGSGRRRIALLLLLLFAASRTFADSREDAASLAKRSLEFLQRGEDSTRESEKFHNYEQGLELAQKALELDDANADAHYGAFANRGRMMWLQGARANPLNVFRLNRDLNRALELNPNHAQALVARGAMCRLLPRFLGGSLVEAETHLKRAIELDPSLLSARMQLAEVYVETDRKAAAITLVEEARALAIEQKRPTQRIEAEAMLKELSAANP